MSAEIVSLRPGPRLDDIPGQLRRLADAIESGEHGEVRSLLALMPVDGDYPAVFGWGEVSGRNDPIIQCELAKAMLVSNIVARG